MDGRKDPSCRKSTRVPSSKRRLWSLPRNTKRTSIGAERMRVHIRRKAKSVRPRYVWNNPGTVIDRSGHVVSTKQECWRLNEVTRPVIVNWNGIESAPDIKDSMKAYLAHVIESNAPQTTQGTF